MNKEFFKDPVSRNIGYLSALVFVVALQVLIVLVFVYQFVPLTMAPDARGIPSTLLKLFHPNRNYFFYHAFVATATIGQALVLYIFRRRLGVPELAGKIREFLMAETVWVSWQLFAVFKILQYDNPQWARSLLYAGFAAALLAKIFWPELKRGLKRLKVWLGQDIPALWRRLADGGLICLLLSAIMIPDGERALLRMAMVDSTNHFNQWLMTPLWAYHKALTPEVQFFAVLNWGALVLVHALVSLAGGLTYVHVVGVLCFLAVAYYTAFYYFLRFWLGILPAIFGVLLAVKLQMFHMGINPLIWVYPDQSVLRHTLDVAVFFCLLVYACGGREVFLWLSSAFIGVSLGYVFDTGVYMLGALYVYLGLLLALKDTRCRLCSTVAAWRKILGLVLLPWALMVIVLRICLGAVVLHSEFWMESFKDIPRWLNGEGSVSIFSCLRDRNFFAFFASFVPPVIYAGGSAWAVSMVYVRRWRREKLFIIPVSVYGLGVYAHFLWHASINEYYMVPLPLVGCICFWAVQCLKEMGPLRQRVIKLIFALIAGIALFTNFLFTYYPNVFNMAGGNAQQEKSFYRANFNFDNDADFVGHWVFPSQRAAVISSFATEILLQADRAPFFYSNLTLMNQLDEGQPGQVFVDKRILGLTGNAGIDALINYLKAHYHYMGEQSHSLVLLQRNHE